MVKNPPASAGDMASSPGPGRYHMPQSNTAREPQLLSLHPRACESQLLKPARLEPMAPQQEATAMRSPRTTMKSSPPLAATREKPTRSNEDPTQPKINK